jgi:phage gp29-like protein
MALFKRKQQPQAAKPTSQMTEFYGQPQQFSESFGSAFGSWHPDALVRDKGIEIYAKMMSDSVCKAAVDQLRASVLSGDAEVQPAEDGKPETAIWVSEQLEQMPGSLAQTLDCLVKDAVTYGWALSEMIWVVKDGQWVISRLDRRDPYWFTWRRAAGNEPWTLWRYTDSYRMNAEEITVDNKYVVYSYSADMTNPWGESELRAAYFPWFIKCKLVPWWADHLQTTATTIFDMTLPDGLDNSTLSGLKDMLSKLFRKQYIARPEGTTLQAMDLKTVAGSQSFEMGLDFCNKEILRAILSQSLTVYQGEFGSGSFALGNVHETLMARKASAIRRSLVEVFTEQALRPLVEFNFGPDEPVPQLSIPEPSVANLQLYAQAMATFESIGVIDASEPWIREKAGLPPADPELMLARPGRANPQEVEIPDGVQDEEEAKAEVAQV